MKRLTYLDSNGWYVTKEDGSKIRGGHVNRLAELEDILSSYGIEELWEVFKNVPKSNMTIAEEFFSRYPNAPKYEKGKNVIPAEICPYQLGYPEYPYCTRGTNLKDCLKCWNRIII